MIIYKIAENGKCKNLQFSKTKRAGYKSMEGDTPPDKETLHTDKYKKYVLIQKQKKTCIRILDEIVHKFHPNYRKPGDVPAWETYQDKIIEILESSKVQEIPVKPFS